jgi:hypothetical protein
MLIFGNPYRKPYILGGVRTGVACPYPQIHDCDGRDTPILNSLPPRDATPADPVMLAYRCGSHTEGSRMDYREDPLFIRTAFRCPVLPDIDIPKTLLVTIFSRSRVRGL